MTGRSVRLAPAKGRKSRDDGQRQYGQRYWTRDNGQDVALMNHHRPVEIELNDRAHDEAEEDGGVQNQPPPKPSGAPLFHNRARRY